MTETSNASVAASPGILASAQPGPLVFISHDSRDAELAKAFSKLIRSVSAGMIKTFRSSDKKGTEGIDFGEEWYKRLMDQLQITSDVVCLFTERSIDRPWILFEAGVARGKLDTPVIGLALGVPLSRVASGPFYQFMNMDDSEEDLTKLIAQLARRVPTLEIDGDVVKNQVALFKASESAALDKLKVGSGKAKAKEENEDSVVARLAEEIKSLPARVAERLSDVDSVRRRRKSGIHPMVLDEIVHMWEPGDATPILVAAGLIRDDLPWLYELALEAYRTAKTGNSIAIDKEISRVRRLAEVMMWSPLTQEMGFGRDPQMIEYFPRLLERVLLHTLDSKQARARRRRPPPKVKES